MADLKRASTAAERQAKLKEQREADGWRRVLVWAHEKDLQDLRDRYPGPRGGIAWAAVIATAKGGKP